MQPDAHILADVMQATWPPASMTRSGPVVLRDGAGGGKRVSAATVDPGWTTADLARAEAAMGAQSLFLIRDGDDVLDDALQAKGYRIVDPVVLYAAPVALLAGDGPKHMTTFPHWPPMQIASALWMDAGIGPERIAVMDRVQGAKCVILGRASDRAAGVAFVACHGPQAMLHALEVAPALRRQGSAQNILRAAAQWAQGQGADTVSLIVTLANAPARALYERMGMVRAGHYHYRQK